MGGFSKYYIFFLCAVFVICASLVLPSNGFDKDMRVTKALAILGADSPDHYPDLTVEGVSAERGRQLVTRGFASKPGGGETRQQSKHFVCTSCHNIEKEDPDLRFADPQARLLYTNEKGIPFLQATTLYGAVNRETFYNGDYDKKYGDLVDEARDNIRAAIQLCAIECAQGRKLKDWELESVLAYLWTIDLKIGDLALDDDQLDFIEESMFDSSTQDSAISLIKSRYLKASPATFGTAYGSMQAAAELAGDPDNGRLVYENSCQHCHEDQRYSFFLLNNSDLTFEHLAEKADGYGRHSIYQVVRYGTPPKGGKRSYMPQYPLEKLSDQQLKDLESYIRMRAGEGE